MAKKDFKTTSELFISGAAADDQAEIQTSADIRAFEKAQSPAIPEGYKLVKESKTERLQILLRPTTHAKLKHYAAKQGISKNELINNLIEDFIKGAK